MKARFRERDREETVMVKDMRKSGWAVGRHLRERHSRARAISREWKASLDVKEKMGELWRMGLI